MQADIAGLKEGQGELKEDVSGLKEDVSGLKEDVSGLKEDVSGLKEDVSGLKEDVSGLKEDLVITRRILVKIENEHGKKLQALIDAQVGYEDTHRRHEPRIIKLEKEVDLLDTKVRSLQVAK